MKALYPGSFDPVTNGHIDIIKRASKMFDNLVIAIGENVEKECFFSLNERLEMLKDAVKHLKNVEITSFKGLMINFAKEIKANVVVRGLRAVSDFDYEFQMALMNRKANKDIETIFIMTKDSYVFLSASAVKEMAMYGGNVKDLVPDLVQKKLKSKLPKSKQ